MALSTSVPPWLDVTPELFLGAAKAGAQAGLEQRGQDIKQSEAANQLRLAYASLASQEERAAQATQAQQQLAAAKLQMAQEQADQLNQYRQGQLGARADELGLRESRGEMLDQWRGQRLGEMEKGLGLREEAMKNVQTANEGRLQAQDAARKLRESALNMRLKQADEALSPLEKGDLRRKSISLSNAEKAYQNAIAAGAPEGISAAQRLLDSAKKDYETVRSSFGTGNVKQGAPRGNMRYRYNKDTKKLEPIEEAPPVDMTDETDTADESP